MTPKDILIDGPRVLRDLLVMVRGADARGLVLHLNNLESLGGRDVVRAADLLLSLRDPMLMHEGLHVVLVGTTDAVTDVVNRHAQVRNVFRAPLILGPLSLAEVHSLLRARYDRWRLRDDRPASSPVESAAVDRLHELFRGDLRGLLKALDDGVEECIGLATPERSQADGGLGAAVPPVSLSELSHALQARYAAVMRSELDEVRIAQLVTWAADDAAGTRTQRELAELWSLSQGAVSTALASFMEAGYVIAYPRQGNDPIRYALSGKSRIIVGLE
jgi:DNA-binding transcriptional ArsR family regulator